MNGPQKNDRVQAPEDDPLCITFDPDDEEMEQTPQDVVDELGFDPKDLFDEEEGNGNANGTEVKP